MIDCRILLKNSTIYGLKIQQIRFKSHLVVLGAGWGGFRLATDVDKNKYDVTVLSPRNHFLFTPLLPSTSVGTLEFRCVQEPVRTIKGEIIDHCIIESGNLLYGTTRRKYPIIWRKWRNKNQFLQIIDPNSLKNR
jgi:hypothetical protein